MVLYDEEAVVRNALKDIEEADAVRAFFADDYQSGAFVHL
jgi:hypothetical protein